MARPALTLEEDPNKHGNVLIMPRTLPNKVLELTSGEKFNSGSFFNQPSIKELKYPSHQLSSYMRTNIYFACDFLLNFNCYPFQAAFLDIMFVKRFIILLMSRGAGKSLLMAIYALLKCLLFPPQEIVSISPTFRQTKGGVFKYIERIYAGSPILQELTNGEVLHYHDYYCLKFHNGSSIIGLPLGTGGSTRGMRSTCTLIDERANINKDVLDVVIRPFTATSSDPMEKSIQLGEIDELLQEGYSKEEIADLYKENFNQLIMGGTASYQFNSYYDEFKRYRNIILGGGNKEKLIKAVGSKINEDNLQYIDPQDFCILKMPYNRLPEGYPDLKDIMQAKASMDSSQFAAEYECVTSDFYVHCVDGFKPIPLVKEGDLTISHDGTFRVIKKKFSREYEGPMIIIGTGGSSFASVERFTLGHPIYTNNGMEKCENIRVGDYLLFPIKRPVVDCENYGGYPVNDKILRIIGKFICCGEITVDITGNPELRFSNLSHRSAGEIRRDIKSVFGKILTKSKKNGNDSNRTIRCWGKPIIDYFRNFGTTIEDIKFPKELSNLPENKTNILLESIVKNIEKEDEPSGIKVVIKNMELGLLIADLFIRNGILVRTYRRVGHDMEITKNGILYKTYVSPRVILRFVTPSDLIYIQDGFLYTKVTATDRRNESHRVFNLEVDGPEHSYSGPSIAVANCTFPSDSDGFFKRGLILSCEKDIPVLLYGSKHKEYVLALDPARAKDRAAITILELDFDGSGNARNSVVYTWSTKESEITDEEIPGEEVNYGDDITRKKRYYKILADKIRNLHERFNIVKIVIDHDGGGQAVKDELQSPPKGKLPYWEVEDFEKINYKGHRILIMRKWNSDWISAANHRCRANMEQKKLIFPKFGVQSIEKLVSKVDGDEYDRIIYEIEELKNEMTSIVVSQTPSGTKERFGLPKKLAGMTTGETAAITDWKDRYSSLIMADFEASEIVKPQPQYQHVFSGGSLDEIAQMYDEEAKDPNNNLHISIDHGFNGTVCY